MVCICTCSVVLGPTKQDFVCMTMVTGSVLKEFYTNLSLSNNLIWHRNNFQKSTNYSNFFNNDSQKKCLEH